MSVTGFLTFKSVQTGLLAALLVCVGSVCNDCLFALVSGVVGGLWTGFEVTVASPCNLVLVRGASVCNDCLVALVFGKADGLFAGF